MRFNLHNLMYQFKTIWGTEENTSDKKENHSEIIEPQVIILDFKQKDRFRGIIFKRIFHKIIFGKGCAPK